MGLTEYGSPRRPASPTDRCPNCGRRIRWHDEDAGNGERVWWIGAAAECAWCGLELRWNPDRHDRVLRRRRAAETTKEEEEEDDDDGD